VIHNAEMTSLQNWSVFHPALWDIASESRERGADEPYPHKLGMKVLLAMLVSSSALLERGLYAVTEFRFLPVLNQLK
jgi:hypothetical protein